MTRKRPYWRANVVLLYQRYGQIKNGWRPRYVWMYDPRMRRAAKFDIVEAKVDKIAQLGWIVIGVYPRTPIPRNACDKARA